VHIDLHAQLDAKQALFAAQLEAARAKHTDALSQLQTQLCSLETRLKDTFLCLETHGFDPGRCDDDV
jgi:hypothetical protein